MHARGDRHSGHPLRVVLLAPTLLVVVALQSALANPWHSPHPWRRDALFQGRTFEYDEKSFLQRFSYRALSERPGPLDDGLSGTVGSLTSDQAYSEIRFRKTFAFDRGGRAFTLAMQRGEDFDGYYDRQLVGFTQKVAENWTLALRGDVQGEKSESDVYFQSRWRPGGHLLELAAVLPDAYFNDKSERRIEYRQRPKTFFARVGLHLGEGLNMEVSANHSPEAEVIDRSLALVASGRQTRAAANLDWRTDAWRMRLLARGEFTERDFDFYAAGAPGQRDFRRIYHRAGVSVTRTAHRLNPTVGIQHFYLDEEGYFGTASNTLGQRHHNEPLLHASIRLDTGERSHLRPELLLSKPDLVQTTVTSDRWRPRDTDAWRGKISLPWRHTVNRDDGAVLTITPSFELHEPGFGGGNVQLHWPL